MQKKMQAFTRNSGWIFFGSLIYRTLTDPSKLVRSFLKLQTDYLSNEVSFPLTK